MSSPVIPPPVGAAPVTAIQSATPAQAAAIMANERTIYEGQPAVIAGLGSLLLSIFTLGIAYLYFYFKRGGTRYRVTTQRIVIDSGIFSKKLEQVDLYRVNDFSVERPFMQRIMGTGNIRMTTYDKSNPEVSLEAVRTDVVELYEKLRVAVEASKQSRGVRVAEYE